MGVPDYVSRANDDGSFDVWVGSWKVHFPLDSEDPTVEKASVPLGVEGIADAGETVEMVAEAVGVSFESRTVLLRESGPAILPRMFGGGGGGDEPSDLKRRLKPPRYYRRDP